MTGTVALRATVALVGILVFAYGARADAPMLRWTGIALLGVAFLLRFVDRTRRR
jgi:hypothetical protein